MPIAETACVNSTQKNSKFLKMLKALKIHYNTFKVSH